MKTIKVKINTFFICTFLISNFLFSQQKNDTKHAFFLKGWNYEKILPIKINRNSSSEKNKFLESIPFNNSIYLFYFQNNTLHFSKFNGKITTSSPIAVTSLEQFRLPVIAANDKNIFIMLHKQNNFYIYQISKNNQVKMIRKFKSSLSFNYDLILQDNTVFAIYPTFIDNKYSTQIMILTFENGKISQKIVPLPTPQKSEKGFFFHRVYKTKNKYIAFFISREYNRDGDLLHDSIYKIQTANLLKINEKDYEKIETSGFINHPPQVVSYKNDDYLIYPSKKKFIYDISLMAFKFNIEYPVDQSYISSYHPLYFQNNSALDLFFITFNKKSSYISHKPVQIDQVENLDGLTETKPSRATSLNVHVQNFAKCELNQMRYLFFKVKENDQIYFTQTDDEATAPNVRLLIPKNSKSERIYPEIAWDLPDDPSGIAGYGYVIDQRPSTTPSIVNLPENERMITTRFLDVGNYFFHIVAIDSLNNVSKVIHTPFSIEDADNAIGFNIKKIFIEEELTQLDISDEMAYPTYKNYIQKAHALILKNKYHLARNYINLASIINPSRIESYVMLQLIDRQETKWMTKHKMHLSVFIFLFTILFLSGTLYRLSHK